MLLLYLQTQERSSWQNSVIIVEKPCRVTPFGIVLAAEMIVTSSRPAKRSLSDGPPAWMKQLETSLTNNRSNVPLRELHVKVWDEEETETSICQRVV